MANAKGKEAAGKTAPAGWKVSNARTIFLRFEEGQEFHGIYLGTQETSDNINKTDERVMNWRARAVESFDFVKATGEAVHVEAGETVLIPEKAVMIETRYNMSEGTEFKIIYDGEEKSPRTGKKFKKFTILTKE